MAKSCYHYPLILETVIMIQIKIFDNQKGSTASQKYFNCVLLIYFYDVPIVGNI